MTFALIQEQIYAFSGSGRSLFAVCHSLFVMRACLSGELGNIARRKTKGE
jgi:hypothetical protein